jgi:ribosomal protein S18 acetylase RimI-like enzyme
MGVPRFVDVTDVDTFAVVPPCADPAFDHRTCDYWEDATGGSKAHREGWLHVSSPPAPPTARRRQVGPFDPFDPDAAVESANPFAPSAGDVPNPFAPATGSAAAPNPFAPEADALADNPFAPRRQGGPVPTTGGPRKLQLLGRGLAVFGSYAKVLMDGDDAVAYAQFGPLSAYPRALRTRELYPQLPDAPLPAVITCIATHAGARGRGYARRLIEAVCEDLAGRGFSAVEAYPTVGAAPDATSAADPAFWERCGFTVAAPDDRYPVMRRELV